MGIKNLQTYKDQDLEVLLVYSRLCKPIKEDLVGAHFIMGKLFDVSDKHITFDGPDGITSLGVKYNGSPFDITSNNTIMVVPVNEIIPDVNHKLQQYKFSTMYDVKMDEVIEAHDPLEGFMLLANTVQSLIADRRIGYTTPVKLEKILNIFEELEYSIKVDKSEFSQDIKVAKSGTGTGYAK
jgi:hypothetical protein